MAARGGHGRLNMTAEHCKARSGSRGPTTGPHVSAAPLRTINSLNADGVIKSSTPHAHRLSSAHKSQKITRDSFYKGLIPTMDRVLITYENAEICEGVLCKFWLHFRRKPGLRTEHAQVERCPVAWAFHGASIAS